MIPCLRCSVMLALLISAIPTWGEDTRKITPDEQAIHNSAVKFVDAYNSRDAASIAALFAPEARMEEADGSFVTGTENITASFAEAFDAEPTAQIGLDMASLKFLTPDVAVEEGATEFFPDGKTLTSRGRYIAVHLKKNDVWKMISVRSFEKQTVTNYEHLRKLDWLIGDWIDEDAETKVETSFQWDEGRNFLLQEFTVMRGVEAIQKGSQRIGWDPQAKQIRGWIFDSQGGFGETRWTPSEGSWVVTAKGVGADGANGSATRTLTPKGDRVEVQVTNRITEAGLQPDAEFTMVRRPPAPVAAAAK